MRTEKCTEEIKIHVGEVLKLELMQLAKIRGHDSLSPFIRQILKEYIYGHKSNSNGDA